MEMISKTNYRSRQSETWASTKDETETLSTFGKCQDEANTLNIWNSLDMPRLSTDIRRWEFRDLSRPSKTYKTLNISAERLLLNKCSRVLLRPRDRVETSLGLNKFLPRQDIFDISHLNMSLDLIAYKVCFRVSKLILANLESKS
jgi:hypothetical protein